ncbi:MAG: DUF3830 family protein [Actinobacteria bacterium]|nr:DUF3830 family protein [Actinomycetota bacterium]
MSTPLGGIPAAHTAGGALPSTGTPAGAAQGIELELPGAPPARYRLLWEQAPKTCAVVLAALPSQAECFHAIYSGTIAAFLLPPEAIAPTENATSCVMPGDLIYTHYEAGVRHGHLNALSEVYWPYDRYARPTIPGLFVPLDAANVFGAYEGTPETWKAFAAACQRLRFDGLRVISIRPYGGVTASSPRPRGDGHPADGRRG